MPILWPGVGGGSGSSDYQPVGLGLVHEPPRAVSCPLVILAVAAVAFQIYAAPKVLILDTTVYGGASSLEAQTAVALGYQVDVVNASQWSALTATDFASYRALILGDPPCGPVSAVAAAQANRAVWGPVVNGNIIIIGTDETLHQHYGGAILTTNGIRFAVDRPGTTGLFVSLSCYYASASTGTPVPVLDPFGVFTVTGVVCYEQAHIVETHPAMNQLSDDILSNWGCSVHEGFSSWPGSFTPLAIAEGAGTSYTGPDLSVGSPYILVSGQGLSPITNRMTLTPESATNPTNTQHTVCAKVVTNGSLAIGVNVVFTIISGPNAGTTATIQTDDHGTACFTYLGAGGAGTDVIVAQYVDVLGQTLTSNEAEKEWIDPCGHGLTASIAQVFCQSNQLFVLFSGPLAGSSATDPSHYSLDRGFTVTGVAFAPGSRNEVIVTADQNFVSFTTYTLQIFNLTNICGDIIVPNPTILPFQCDPRCPGLVCPTNMVVQCEGTAGTEVDFDPFVDPGCSNVTLICVPPSGSLFPAGTTFVTCTALQYDSFTNLVSSNSCIFSVTVTDSLPPLIYCATNKYVECGTAWDFDPPRVLDNCCPSNMITVVVLSTVTNTLGPCQSVITRTWQATDCNGNPATCSQIVTIADSTPPTLSCNSNKFVNSCPDCFMRGVLDYSVLWNFSRTVMTNGYYPSGSVIGASDGVLYGTTFRGGSDDRGTVFKLNKDGSGFGVLHTFSGAAGPGSGPQAGVTEASDGWLYGTTVGGGTSPTDGTVYRLQKDGSLYQVLHNFTGPSTDGAGPYAGVIEGDDGAIYGTTVGGGENGVGTVYKLNKNGTGFQLLHSFSTSSDGYNPEGGLLKAYDGNLYGVTTYSDETNVGTIFTLKQDGSGYQVLHRFAASGAEGTRPGATLIQGNGLALFGVTFAGGAYGGGTIFTLQPGGSGFAVLHDFSGTGGDGYGAHTPLIEAVDGMLYGTADAGGSGGFNGGMIFRLNPNGSGFAGVKSFSGPDGYFPRSVGGLFEDSDGEMYGTTYYGGSTFATPASAVGDGIVFKLGCPRAWTFDVPSARDVCCTNVAVQMLSTTASNLGPCSVSYTRTWLAADCCSNTSTCSQTVTVAYTNPPAVTCNPNKLVGCGMYWTFDDPSGFAPCCDTNPPIVTVLSTVTNSAPPCYQLATRVWQLTDCCSNSVTCTQTVTIIVSDTTPPVVTCPGDKTVTCGAGWRFDHPLAMDDCSGTNVILGVVTNIISGGGCFTAHTRVWQVSDLCNNSVLCTQTVTVVSATGPMFVCPLGSPSNLVPNPGFENLTACPDSVSELSRAAPWFSATVGGTSDLFNDCSSSPAVGVPANLFGNQAPHGGHGYGGGKEYPEWEYLSSPLAAPLTAGQTYEVSFYVSLADNSQFALDNLGVCFSTGPLPDPSGFYAVPLTTFTPQVQNRSGDFLTSKTSWTLVRGWFTAAGGENYLTIGNFYDAFDTPTLFVGGVSSIVYYYFDDVSVSPLATGCCPDKVVAAGSAWTFDQPVAVSGCCGDVPVNILNTVTNAGLCQNVITRTWEADCCGITNTCSQTVTVVSTAAPPNDECAHAIAISPYVSSAICGTTTCATPSVPGSLSPAPCGSSLASPDVWYSLTLPCSGSVYLSTCGQCFLNTNNPLNAVLSVYTGTCGALTQVPGACSDGSPPSTCSPQAQLTFLASAGVKYYIRVAGTNGATGNFLLNVGPPACTNGCLSIRCPTNTTVISCCTNARVNYTVTVTDLCTTNVTVVYTQPPGSDFLINASTLVICTATDEFGSTAQCQFAITVNMASPTVVVVGTNIVVTWPGPGCGVLQQAPAVTGPWTDVPGAMSPYVTPLSAGGIRFFRLRCN
jgi:uncharacterized repeat protein (TIGR03803 family)